MKYGAPETWVLVLMSVTTWMLYAIEPLGLMLALRFPEFRTYIKTLFEDADGKPNTVDARNAMVLYSALWVLRGIIHTVMFIIGYDRDLLGLLGVLIGLFCLLLGLKKIEEKL